MPPSPMSDLIPFPKRINGRTQWIGSRSDSALNHSCSLSVDHHGAALSIRSSRRRCSSAGRSAIALSFCSLTDRRGNGSPRAKTSSITSWSSVRSRRTWLTLAREQWSFRAKSAPRCVSTVSHSFPPLRAAGHPSRWLGCRRTASARWRPSGLSSGCRAIC